MSLEGFPDETLLALVARADEAALGILYDRYASAMLGLARRMGFNADAQEDAVQEIFIRIWKKAASFDNSKASGRSWILAVGHHYCVDKVRAEAIRPKALEPFQNGEGQDEAFDVAGEGLNEENALNRIRITRALAVLDSTERSIIEALHYKGYTYPEAALLLELPLGTLKAKLSKAMTKLREVLREA
jgi:RNA polymerase sigma-70 factor, ECF subfamily